MPQYISVPTAGSPDRRGLQGVWLIGDIVGTNHPLVFFPKVINIFGDWQSNCKTSIEIRNDPSGLSIILLFLKFIA